MYSDFAHTDLDVGLRRQIIDLDTAMLGECRRVYTNARNTASRLEKFNGLRAEPLYHPPRLAGRLAGGPAGDYILSVGRLETVKRHDLAVRALALARGPRRLVIVGEGTQEPTLRRLAEELAIGDRVTLRRRGRPTNGCSRCTRARSASCTPRSTRTTAT